MQALVCASADLCFPHIRPNTSGVLSQIPPELCHCGHLVPILTDCICRNVPFVSQLGCRLLLLRPLVRVSTCAVCFGFRAIVECADDYVLMC
jgi:hypothetical protein